MEDIKICNVCEKEKPISEFAKRTDRPGVKYRCKTCDTEYARKYVENNPEKIYSYQRERKDLLKIWFAELKTKPCTDCKQTFPPCCMDFDHLDHKTKKKTLATLVGDGYSKDLILKEIDKCELVCANCHRIRTEKRGWSLWEECERRKSNGES